MTACEPSTAGAGSGVRRFAVAIACAAGPFAFALPYVAAAVVAALVTGAYLGCSRAFRLRLDRPVSVIGTPERMALDPRPYYFGDSCPI